MEMEQFCDLIVVVVTPVYTCDNTAQTPPRVHEVVQSEEGLQLLLSSSYCTSVSFLVSKTYSGYVSD